MTKADRDTARGALVRARDAAHAAICALDKADEFEAIGPAGQAAIPAMCATACASVTELVSAVEAVATMQAACQQEGE
jgi:hypothetical protein